MSRAGGTIEWGATCDDDGGLIKAMDTAVSLVLNECGLVWGIERKIRNGESIRIPVKALATLESHC